jgi:hypothetical protein
MEPQAKIPHSFYLNDFLVPVEVSLIIYYYTTIL